MSLQMKNVVRNASSRWPAMRLPIFTFTNAPSAKVAPKRCSMFVRIAAVNSLGDRVPARLSVPKLGDLFWRDALCGVPIIRDETELVPPGN